MNKSIYKKKIGNIIYDLRLRYNKYIIYECCEQFSKPPEKATFDNEKDAREFLEKLANSYLTKK